MNEELNEQLERQLNEQVETLAKIQDLAVTSAVNYGPKIVVALVILLLGVYAGRWAAKMMDKGLNRFELELPVRQLLSRIVQGLVLGLFAVMALQNIGVELLPLIAGIGVIGAGVALAMQGVLGNLAAGLTIIFTRPFRVGEYVSMLGEEGEVETITLFNTVLGHPDLSRVVIPNRLIVGEIMHNYGRVRQINVTVGVAYDTDLNKALASIDEILKANPKVLGEPVPLLQVATLADSSINISVSPWVDVSDYVLALGELNKAIVEAFRDKGINIPFPQREVRMLGSVS
jgi:small conductance mechanosensitive channel